MILTKQQGTFVNKNVTFYVKIPTFWRNLLVQSKPCLAAAAIFGSGQECRTKFGRGPPKDHFVVIGTVDSDKIFKLGVVFGHKNI